MSDPDAAQSYVVREFNVKLTPAQYRELLAGERVLVAAPGGREACVILDTTKRATPPRQ